MRLSERVGVTGRERYARAVRRPRGRIDALGRQGRAGPRLGQGYRFRGTGDRSSRRRPHTRHRRPGGFRRATNWRLRSRCRRRRISRRTRPCRLRRGSGCRRCNRTRRSDRCASGSLRPAAHGRAPSSDGELRPRRRPSPRR